MDVSGAGGAACEISVPLAGPHGHLREDLCDLLAGLREGSAALASHARRVGTGWVLSAGLLQEPGGRAAVEIFPSAPTHLFQ